MSSLKRTHSRDQRGEKARRAMLLCNRLVFRRLPEELGLRASGWLLVVRANLGDKCGHALHGDFYLWQSRGKAAAHMALAALTKCGAGNDGDIFLMQEAERKFPACESTRCDFRKHVKRAARAAALEAHFVERADDEIAPQLILAPHECHAFGAPLEGFDGGILSHNGRAED